MDSGQAHSDTEFRPLAQRILLLQGGIAVGLALFCLALWGQASAVSALAGGAIGLIANLYMTLNAMRPTRTAQAALGRLLFGQLVKVALTVAMFLAVARAPRLHWPALLIAYLATLVVFWWVPMWMPPQRAAPRRDDVREL